MISVSINPHSLLLCSPASDTSWFSLSHKCAQIAVSGTLTRLKGPSSAMIFVQYDHGTCEIIDLFLDFKENFPHSHSQTDKHDD
jgi:hypothetical protein